MRLTDMETQLDNGGRGNAVLEGNAVELSLKRGERERQLEVMVSIFFDLWYFQTLNISFFLIASKNQERQRQSYSYNCSNHRKGMEME